MIQNRPLFSIITITYNAAKELPATMRSVAKQKCCDYEHLIIDGASKDDTLKIAEKMGTERMRLYSEPDKGLYDAMNKGIRKSEGKYLIFLNAGDAFKDNEVLASIAGQMHLCPDIVYGDTDLVNADREFVGRRHLSAPERLTFESFRRGMLVCHQAFVVRRDIAPEYDLKYRFSADYEWCLRCLKKSNPDKNINLKKVIIEYLTDGLTDKNHKASLKERFAIMCDYYGRISAILFHLSFLFRYLLRKCAIIGR